MAKKKLYAVGKAGDSKVFWFATLKAAENKIAAFMKTDAEGVARGDYYIDGPEEKFSPADKSRRMLWALKRALVHLDHACDDDNFVNENKEVGRAIAVIQESITEATR